MQVKLSRNEKYTITILIAMVTFWLTESLHGLEIATVTIIGVFINFTKSRCDEVERKFERCLLELNFICWKELH